MADPFPSYRMWLPQWQTSNSTTQFPSDESQFGINVVISPALREDRPVTLELTWKDDKAGIDCEESIIFFHRCKQCTDRGDGFILCKHGYDDSPVPCTCRVLFKAWLHKSPQRVIFTKEESVIQITEIWDSDRDVTVCDMHIPGGFQKSELTLMLRSPRISRVDMKRNVNGREEDAEETGSICLSQNSRSGLHSNFGHAMRTKESRSWRWQVPVLICLFAIVLMSLMVIRGISNTPENVRKTQPIPLKQQLIRYYAMNEDPFDVGDHITVDVRQFNTSFKNGIFCYGITIHKADNFIPCLSSLPQNLLSLNNSHTEWRLDCDTNLPLRAGLQIKIERTDRDVALLADGEERSRFFLGVKIRVLPFYAVGEWVDIMAPASMNWVLAKQIPDKTWRKCDKHCKQPDEQIRHKVVRKQKEQDLTGVVVSQQSAHVTKNQRQSQQKQQDKPKKFSNKWMELFSTHVVIASGVVILILYCTRRPVRKVRPSPKLDLRI